MFLLCAVARGVTRFTKMICFDSICVDTGSVGGLQRVRLHFSCLGTSGRARRLRRVSWFFPSPQFRCTFVFLLSPFLSRDDERLLIRNTGAYEITRDVVTGSADYSRCATSCSCLFFSFWPFSFDSTTIPGTLSCILLWRCVVCGSTYFSQLSSCEKKGENKSKNLPLLLISRLHVEHLVRSTGSHLHGHLLHSSCFVHIHSESTARNHLKKSPILPVSALKEHQSLSEWWVCVPVYLRNPRLGTINTSLFFFASCCCCGCCAFQWGSSHRELQDSGGPQPRSSHRQVSFFSFSWCFDHDLRLRRRQQHRWRIRCLFTVTCRKSSRFPTTAFTTIV